MTVSVQINGVEELFLGVHVLSFNIIWKNV